MNGKYTLVIPTYNRAALVQRLVRYYVRQRNAMEILVLDSSRPEIAAENAAALAALGDTVRHVAYPGTLPMAAKLAQGLQRVRTEFVSFCADDDVVFPGGIAEALAFLESHPDYACAHGLYLNFNVSERNVDLMREYAGPGNEAGHAGARVFRLFQQYESLFYAAYRTADLARVFDGVHRMPTLHYQELFQSVAVLILGKAKRFGRFYAARQSCEAAQPERDKWQTYYWFAENPAEVLQHYGEYRGALWAFYEANGAAPRLERPQFERAMDLAHAVYFATGCPPEYFYSMLQPMWPDDPYVRVGRLELLKEVEKAGVPNVAGLLERNPAADMIDALYGPRAPGGGLAARVRRKLGAWRASRDLAAGMAADGSGWNWRLSTDLSAVAAAPDFGAACAELGRYLSS